ncbi:hypothetical protein E1218_34425, partial [Kribbella turkmenica]
MRAITATVAIVAAGTFTAAATTLPATGSPVLDDHPGLIAELFPDDAPPTPTPPAVPTGDLQAGPAYAPACRSP